jgi:hypothetical protein
MMGMFGIVQLHLLVGRGVSLQTVLLGVARRQVKLSVNLRLDVLLGHLNVMGVMFINVNVKQIQEPILMIGI